MNIIDYCLWRGDLSFKADPFNYVDNLLLTQLAYSSFDRYLKNNEIKTVKELAQEFFADSEHIKMLESKSFISDTPYALKAMGQTKRFGNCKVYNYVSILHPETTEQFAALMIDLGDNTTAVVFRGTDDTLVGWHEDLLLSYTLMPAQIDAVNYVNKNCKAFHKYRLLGHSKGGNLALYSAINCDKRVQNRIIQVISNDGPGLRPETYNEDTFNKFSNRYIKIVPEYDLFGVIYDNAKNKIVVKSSQKEFLQHSGMTWQVIGNQFETVKDINYVSKLYKQGFDKFMQDTSNEQRSTLIKELFNYLDKAGINNISDFAKGGIPLLVKALKGIIEINPEAKETLGKLIKVFVDAQGDLINKSISESKDYVKNKASKVTNNIETILSDRIKAKK